MMITAAGCESRLRPRALWQVGHVFGPQLPSLVQQRPPRTLHRAVRGKPPSQPHGCKQKSDPPEPAQKPCSVRTPALSPGHAFQRSPPPPRGPGREHTGFPSPDAPDLPVRPGRHSPALLSPLVCRRGPLRAPPKSHSPAAPARHRPPPAGSVRATAPPALPQRPPARRAAPSGVRVDAPAARKAGERVAGGESATARGPEAPRARPHKGARGRAGPGGDDTWPPAGPMGPGGQGGRGPGGPGEAGRMGLGARTRGPRHGSGLRASDTGPGSRSPSPSQRRRVCAWGSQRLSVRTDARRPDPRPAPGATPTHLSRERRHEPEPRSSSRAVARTMAAILGLRPLLLSSLPGPPPTPRPYGAGPRRSGARFRCRERKPRREAGSGGRAAGDGGGRLGPRPGRSRGHGAAAAGLGRAGAAGPAAMAGYTRRPGVPPLSRARSLVIPDGERPGRAAGPSPPGPGAAPAPAAPGRAAGEAGRGARGQSLSLLLQPPRSLSAGRVCPS